jgi:hypothetical protein
MLDNASMCISKNATQKIEQLGLRDVCTIPNSQFSTASSFCGHKKEDFREGEKSSPQQSYLYVRGLGQK